MPRKHLEEVLSKMDRHERMADNIQIALCTLNIILSLILTVRMFC